MERSSTVFVVDDDVDYVESLRALIGSMGFAAKAFPSAEAFLESFDESESGCLILDLRLPGLGGIELLQRLAATPLAPPAIVLTGHADVRSAVAAVRAEAIDFLEKAVYSQTALWEAIHQALARDAERRTAHARRSAIRARFAALSDTESVVLDLLLRGKDHGEIAEAVSKSRRTVENRRAKIMKKLGVSSFPELIRLAIEADVDQPQ